MQETTLEGKVAIVTGAGRGIGRSIAEGLSGAGARVVLAARSADELEAVREAIEGRGGEAIAIPADVSSEEDVARLFREVERSLGRLDVLVNNAGIGAFGPVDAVRTEDIDPVFAVNVRGAFLCSREALRIMKRQGGGTIVNISSVVGVRGYPNQSVYTASKHALQGLTKSLAVEAQEHGIRVSAVLPGGVATDLIRRARPDIEPAELLQPEDVTRCVLFLLSLPERAAVDEIRIRRRTRRPW